MRIFPRCSWLAALLVVAVPATSVPAQTVRNVQVNLRNVEIEQAAEQISRITGRTLVLDPNVRGSISVISSGPVGPDAAFDLFRAALRVNGYAAVRSGAVYRIVPQAAAVQGTTVVDVRGRAGGQEVVTRLIPLRSFPSADAVRILRPLVASFGSIEGSTRPNAIVVTDYADNVRRIERIARSLDGSGGGASGASFQSIRLRNAGAAEVAGAITRILGDETAGGPRVAGDERSNTVLIRGTAAAIAEARRIAEQLDAGGGVQAATRVFRLRNSDAESIAEILRGLLGAGGQATNPVARTLADNTPESAIGAGLVNRFENGSQGGGLLGAALGRAGQARNGEADRPAGSAASAGFSTPDIAIQPATELNAIVARGSPAAIASIEGLIAELDVRRPQVTIEAAIVEITGDAAEALGIQLGLGAAAQLGNLAGTSFTNSGVSLGQILTTLGAPAALGIGAGLSAAVGSRGEFSVLLQAFAQSSKANLLSTPSLTTLDNQPAEIVVGQNVPFRTGSFVTEGNINNPFTTIEREDVGITLRVVPRVHEGDVVKLEVSQEVSSLVNGNVVGAADLITNRRSIKTTVLADNGGTIVLGGLITDDRLTSRSRVPVLGDIPIIGNLFRSRRESQTKRTLFVFLRPTILRDRAAVAAQAGAQYSRLRAEEALQEETRDLLADPPGARLPVQIEGVY